ncbi:MAG TPA: phosphate regulon sensor histidine kinase PhoR [Gammaproteobacteria bacterium]|nr:phosphate regulon sensor histidine kinase PhoR [Gammaproteobacteria bacterium]
MRRTWYSELAQFLWIGIVVGLLGALAGHLTLALLVYTLVYLGWYFNNLRRLERWLRLGRKFAPPDARGLWGEVFNGIYRLQQRNRKRRKRLVKLLNRFRETTGAMPDGIIILQPNGGIEWWNEAAERLLRLKYPQDVCQHLNNLIRHPDFVAFINGETDAEDVTIPSPYDAQQLLNIRMIPYGKRQQLVLVRDVTLMERVEQMRRDFVANISHELRTPLTVLSGYIENLQNGEHSRETVQRALAVMAQQSRRMQHLTEDLMLLSNLENRREQRREKVNVAQMLDSLLEEARLVSGERAHVIDLAVDDGLEVLGDPRELDSIFSNLVINAVNYTPAGGEIHIRWHRDEDGGAVFEVTDTGLGIPAHHLPRLTERFYRVDVARSRETGGSGLGLAIVKHALQRLGGRLEIESEVGRGSTFRARFPAEVVVQAPAPEGADELERTA